MEHFDGLWAEINPREHERFVKDPGEERALSRQWERKRMRGPGDGGRRRANHRQRLPLGPWPMMLFDLA